MSAKANFSSEEPFWRALEFAVGSTSPEDLTEIGAYVASRGDAFVAYFNGCLHEVLTELRATEVPQTLREAASTPEGRPIADLSDSEMDGCLQAMLLPGKPYFDALLANSEIARGPKEVPLINLQRAVENAQAANTPTDQPLWEERPGDRRRDGDPWIVIHLGLGIGVAGPNTHPWNSRAFTSRFRRVALQSSLDQHWRTWRQSSGTRSLDVAVEYWDPTDEPERAVLTQQGRRPIVTVYRDADLLTSADQPAILAQREATAALELARTVLDSGRPPAK